MKAVPESAMKQGQEVVAMGYQKAEGGKVKRMPETKQNKTKPPETTEEL